MHSLVIVFTHMTFCAQLPVAFALGVVEGEVHDHFTVGQHDATIFSADFRE